MSKTKALWRILGPNRVDLIGKWRKLHNEEIHNLYSSYNFIKSIKYRSREVYSMNIFDEKRIQNFSRRNEEKGLLTKHEHRQ